jgi:mannose-1-phosphate guanylyltransferase
VRGYVHRGYWIDIGTPEKYLQVHHDILSGSFPVTLEGRPHQGGVVHEEAVVAEGAQLTAPFYIGPRCRVADGASVGPQAVLTANVALAEGARVSDSVLWEGTTLGEKSRVEGALLGQRVRVDAFAQVTPGSVLGADTVLTAYSRT